MHWPTSLDDIGIVSIIAAAAVIANIIGYLMKTMIPLRLVAMMTNCLFITWSSLAGIYPTLILNCILLPINALRFFQMKRLIKQVNEAANGDLSMEWLKPFTTKKNFAAGTVLFRKGDPASELHFLISGRFRVVEPDVELAAGSIIGELGLLEPGKSRTATVECIESGETLAISYDHVMQLYFQNPTFGFYFLQLSTARLFHTIKGLEAENAELRTANARLSAGTSV
ncbi:MAG: cyclic nucleotide-binding domain-containing protein [Pseudolabrys sp.]|nr:cyclic nucleotide-binding domain-containing protein [Pseudolabrys sp.]MDP2295887.1 cyclic nucleotide-binding domain-containing protein [Pseudolabrys sp.]